MIGLPTRITLRRSVIATVALLSAILVVMLGVIPAAQAHDYLVGSTPKSGSTVTTAPGQVSLKFNDIVLTRPAPPQLSVRGPGGRYYETGCAKVTDTTVVVPVALGGPGKYTVTWRIVSADGHPVSDNISFRFDGKAPGKGVAAPKACTERVPNAEKHSGSGIPTAAVVVVVVIAVLGVGGAAAILLTRDRDRQADDADEADDDEE